MVNKMLRRYRTDVCMQDSRDKGKAGHCVPLKKTNSL